MAKLTKAQERIEWLNIWADQAEARGRRTLARELREEADAIRLSEALGQATLAWAARAALSQAGDGR